DVGPLADIDEARRRACGCGHPFCAPAMPQTVILGLVPRIQLSANTGASRWMDGRDKPDHDDCDDVALPMHLTRARTARGPRGACGARSPAPGAADISPRVAGFRRCARALSRSSRRRC